MEEEVYVSTDIESDGPSPGDYSMLSFGSVAFRRDRTVLGTFTRNLQPLPGAKQHPSNMAWWETQPAAWAAARLDPVLPADGMRDYLAWVKGLPTRQPVFVAYPVSFDFTFVSWYLHHFTGENPFGFAAVDLPTYASAVLGRSVAKSGKPLLPKEWFDPRFQHTHVALDDAMGHAMLFCGMLEASEKGRRLSAAVAAGEPVEG